jgi:hypothetical protein
MDILVNEIKEMYNLSEDECLLLKLFILTRGHNLSEYEYELNAPLHYPQLQDENIGSIMASLVAKTNSDIIGITGDRKKIEYNLTETFKERLKDIKIPYIGVVLFKNYGNAKEAKPSLNEIFNEENNNILYVYLALTPPEAFPSLESRIAKKNKTIFFMSHKRNFHKEHYDDCMKKWVDFIKKHGEGLVEFYLVKYFKKENGKKIDSYRFLYSSLLAQNTVRFNIYKYNENGKVETGIGNLLESQIMDKHSLYDIVEHAYIDVWNKRIGVWKIDKKEYLRRLFVNNFFWILFIIIMIFSIFIFVLINRCQTKSIHNLLMDFISAMSIIGFLLSLCKQKIIKIFRKQELFLRENQ